jgi:hypothetical protein
MIIGKEHWDNKTLDYDLEKYNWPDWALSVIQEKAQAHVNPLLQTLQGLVGIESGSRDLQGLAQLANLIAGQLKALDMTVQVIPTKAPDFHPQF